MLTLKGFYFYAFIFSNLKSLGMFPLLLETFEGLFGLSLGQDVDQVT